MTDKQKKAVRVLNTLHHNLSLTFFSDDDYFLLLEFIIGNQEDKYTTSDTGTFITTIKEILENDKKKIIDIPQTVLYGCSIPDSLSFYSSTETDNSKKVE